MCCCRSQIAIDYMKFCINPLCLVYVPAPSPPPHQLRPFFPKLGPYHLTVFTLTRGIQGCPKIISLDKNTRHSTLKNLSNPPFFCRFASVHSCNTFCQKCSSFSTAQGPENLSPIFSSPQFFHPCLTNAGYLCRRIFGTSLLNPARRAPGFTREGGRGGKQITSTLPQFYCPLSPNS